MRNPKIVSDICCDNVLFLFLRKEHHSATVIHWISRWLSATPLILLPHSSCLRQKWPQTPSTGSGKASVSMTTQHYERRFRGQAQCAVCTSWTPGLPAPPTSGWTGGGGTTIFMLMPSKDVMHVCHVQFFNTKLSRGGQRERPWSWTRMFLCGVCTLSLRLVRSVWVLQLPPKACWG